MTSRRSSAQRDHVHTPSALRLRLGAAFLIIWAVPLWTLAPVITGLFGFASPVIGTTVVVVGQTILGLAGLWLAGTQVRRIIKGKKLKESLQALWAVLVRGKVTDPTRTSGSSRNARPPS